MSCFLVPWILPDGSRNAFAIQRLKEKPGNRSNASSKIELDGTIGWLVGSAAGMHAALLQAHHHTLHRQAFGGRLVDKPLMANVLADMAIESDAARTLASGENVGDAPGRCSRPRRFGRHSGGRVCSSGGARRQVPGV